MRFVRSAALLSAVSVVALAGCQRNPATAAYVGDQTVSTKQLQNAVTKGYTDQSVRSAWSKNDYRGQVLENQIFHVLLQRAAKQAGVSAPSGAGSQVAALMRAANQSGASGVDSALVKLGVARSQQSAYFDDIALAGQLAVQRGLLSVYQIGLIAVPDQATASKVGTAIQANESTYAKFAKKYASQYTAPTPQAVDSAAFAQYFGAAKGNAVRSHTGFVATTPDGTALWVVHIFSADVPVESIPATAQAEVAQDGMTKLQSTLLRKPGVSIKINPRFGTWNAKKGSVTGAVSPAMRTPDTSTSKSPLTSQ